MKIWLTEIHCLTGCKARNETKTCSSHGQDNMSVKRWIFYTHTDVCISCLKGMLMSCSFRFFVLLAHHPSDDAVLSSCCGDLEMSHLSMRSVNTVFPCVPWFGKEVWISFNLNKILCEILFFAFSVNLSVERNFDENPLVYDFVHQGAWWWLLSVQASNNLTPASVTLDDL